MLLGEKCHLEKGYLIGYLFIHTIISWIVADVADFEDKGVVIGRVSIGKGSRNLTVGSEEYRLANLC